MPNKTLILVAALAAASAATATPSDRLTQRFETRQSNQAARIAAGVEAGQIGSREQTALGRQQAALDRAFDRRIEDGRLGYRDARALDRRFDNGRAGIRVARTRGGPRG